MDPVGRVRSPAFDVPEVPSVNFASPSVSSPDSARGPGLRIALLIALVGVAGSLWLSLGMGLKACPLCFYQRSFVMAAAGALVFGLGARTADERRLAHAIATFATAAGLGVAIMHVSLEIGRVLECPKGLFGVGTAPQQSLALLAILFGWLTAQARFGNGKRYAVAVVLGAVATWGCIASAPAIAKAPAKPYVDPLLICRPPYVAAN